MKAEKSPKMYFAVIECVPKKGTAGFTRYGGAHAACWVNTVDKHVGRERATCLIEGQGWHVKSVKEEKTISAEDCPDREGGLQYFNQALTDSEVCVIYTFPKAKRA